MALPTRSQENYTALKIGTGRNLIDPKNAKANRKAYKEKLDKENNVSDEELKCYVNDIFRKDLRTSFYNTLIEVKNNPKAVIIFT